LMKSTPSLAKPDCPSIVLGSSSLIMADWSRACARVGGFGLKLKWKFGLT